MLTPLRKGSEYHHGNLAGAAIRAARDLVLQDGVGALGMRKVALRVNVTPAALYRHFSSLEELRGALSASVRNEIAELMSSMREKVGPATLSKTRSRARFTAIGDAYLLYAQKNPRLFEIAFLACEDFDFENGDGAWMTLLQSLQELERSGLLPSRNREKAARLAWTAIHGLASLYASESIPKSEYQKFRKTVLGSVEEVLFTR
jgi:AcrR family transcriptional regulator